MSMTITALGFAVYVDRVVTYIKKILAKVLDLLVEPFYYVKRSWERLVSPLWYFLLPSFLSSFFLTIVQVKRIFT